MRPPRGERCCVPRQIFTRRRDPDEAARRYQRGRFLYLITAPRNTGGIGHTFISLGGGGGGPPRPLALLCEQVRRRMDGTESGGTCGLGGRVSQSSDDFIFEISTVSGFVLKKTTLLSSHACFYCTLKSLKSSVQSGF